MSDGADEGDGPREGNDAGERDGPDAGPAGGGGDDEGDGGGLRDAAPDAAVEATDGATESVLAVEWTVMAASVVVTLLLLGFLVYSAATTPATAPPTVEVVGATPTGDGGERVRLALTNNGATGLVVATVSVECGDVSTEVEFRNVPATNTVTGVVVCPAGAERTVAVRSWTVA